MMEKVAEDLHGEAERDFIMAHKVLDDAWIDGYSRLLTQVQTGYDYDLIQAMQDKTRRLHALAYRRKSSSNELNQAVLNTLIHMADSIAEVARPHALALTLVGTEVETLLYLLSHGERMKEEAIREELDLTEDKLRAALSLSLTHGLTVRTYGSGNLWNVNAQGQLVLHHLKEFRLHKQGKRR